MLGFVASAQPISQSIVDDQNSTLTEPINVRGAPGFTKLLLQPTVDV